MNKFTKEDWCWQLPDGRVWSTAKVAFVTAVEAEAWRVAQGLEDIPASPVDKEGQHSEEGLREALHFYGLSLGEIASEQERQEARMTAIKLELAALDAKYLTPRTLSDIPLGVPDALERKRQHEELAAPLREELGIATRAYTSV